MNDTTFPSYPGQEQDNQQHQSGTQYGNNNPNYQNNQGGQKPWQNNNGGNYQKKPWQGGSGGGGGSWQKKPWQGGSGFKRAEETDMSLYKPYACTGNADCPAEILEKFDRITKKLEELGYTVRVGGMDGIEDRIEKLIPKHELHLPWRDFNGKQSKFTYNSERTFAIAKMFFPTFDTMKKGVQAFLAKNARLILGDKVVSPALFLLCWTEDGAESVKERTNRTGFTGHPIAIASAVGIPVFNLAKSDAEQRLDFLIEGTRLNVQS